jgi:DNA-binding beta-propeller fold protein YncE
MAAKDDNVWLAITGQGQIAQIDTAANAIDDPITVGQSPRRMLIRDHELWVTNTDAATVTVVPLE